MPGSTRKILLLVGLALALGLLTLAACSASPSVATPCPSCPTPAPRPTAVTCPEAVPCPTAVPGVEAPFESLWKNSAHAKADAPAFTHWNDAKEVDAACARCHSSTGFQNLVSGKEAVKVPTGSVITCTTCHNDATAKLTSVKFPSGLEVKGLGAEAICMTCHQGTSSKPQVDQTLKDAGLTDPDTVVAADKKLAFINVHYLAAAATRYGTLAKGGYEYDGQSYDTEFNHVLGYQTCIQCHDQHSLEVKVNECQACHTDVKTVDDLKNVRMNDSLTDYDGNGDIKGGISTEIDGLRAKLLTAIQTYAKEVSKSPVVYDAATYPYFFIDTNANGTAEKEELVFANAYTAWTARLMEASYNYQYSIKDPGAFAHNPKYVIELLFDSITSLNEKVTAKVDMAKANRTSSGHFSGSNAPFRDWDQTGVVPAGCARCHSGTGLPQFISEGTVVSQPAVDGFMCETCHNDLAKFTRYEVKSVTFPSGKSVSFAKNLDSNLCISCHQGRESTVSMNKAITGSGFKDDQAVTDPKDPAALKFRNIHYFAAGATLFGTEVQGWYEYANQKYAGRFAPHAAGPEGCTNCHDAHTQAVKTDLCQGCHQTNDPFTITLKDHKDPVAKELDAMRAKVQEGIYAYAKDVVKQPVVYDPAAYPYWFIDKNANGTHEADETDQYPFFTPRMLRAAYDLHASIKDPGAFAHNYIYAEQVLYDAMSDLKTKVPTLDISAFTRPAVPATK
jgi:hypothetical protein